MRVGAIESSETLGLGLSTARHDLRLAQGGEGCVWLCANSRAGMDFVGADRIQFQAANPKRRRTGAWVRYERYKIAATVEEARSLGATTEDLRHDVSKAFAVVVRRHEISPPRPPKRQRGRRGVPHEEGKAQGPPTASLQEGPQGGNAQEISTPLLQEAPQGGKAQGTSTASLQEDPQGATTASSKRVIQKMQQELVTARECTAKSQAELLRQNESVSKLKEELAESRARESSLNPGPQRAQALALDPQGLDAAERLALKACAVVEGRVSVEDHSRIQAVATWIKWLVTHISSDAPIIRDHSVRVVAAVILHAAWGLEFGQGLPLAKTLEYAVACSWSVSKGGPRLQILLMKLLGLTASDCVQSKAVYSTFIRMLWDKGPVGLPGPPAEML